MAGDVVIYHDPDGRPQAVLVENGQSVEWIRPAPEQAAWRQDIILGRIESVDRALGAFVAIGQTENALLPLREIPAGSRPGQSILVQVRRLITDQKTNMPIDKGHLLTTRLQYPGLFAVYEPDSDRIIERSKSRLLPSEDRLALLETEIAKLKDCHVQARSAAEIDGPVPRLIHRPRDIHLAALADWGHPELRSIQCKDVDVFSRLDTLLTERWPALRPKLILRPDAFDLQAAFRLGSLAQDVSKRVVRLKNGGGLVFDQTEALLVIDVNTQQAQASDPETLRSKTNELAACEIARQLRLRNCEGVVVIDFIRMKREEDRDELVRTFLAELKHDRGKITMGGMTRLGLFELVRKVP